MALFKSMFPGSFGKTKPSATSSTASAVPVPPQPEVSVAVAAKRVEHNEHPVANKKMRMNGAGDGGDVESENDSIGPGQDVCAEEPLSNADAGLPLSSVAELKGHRKVVCTLSLEPAGNRLLTGSYDYTIKFWDFNGMDSSLRSFRSIQPCEDQQIRRVQYSLRGDSFLVVSGSPHIKLMDREGQQICEFAKGDMYLRDMRHTRFVSYTHMHSFHTENQQPTS